MVVGGQTFTYGSVLASASLSGWREHGFRRSRRDRVVARAMQLWLRVNDPDSDCRTTRRYGRVLVINALTSSTPHLQRHTYSATLNKADWNNQLLSCRDIVNIGPRKSATRIHCKSMSKEIKYKHENSTFDTNAQSTSTSRVSGTTLQDSYYTASSTTCRARQVSGSVSVTSTRRKEEQSASRGQRSE